MRDLRHATTILAIVVLAYLVEMVGELWFSFFRMRIINVQIIFLTLTGDEDKRLCIVSTEYAPNMCRIFTECAPNV